MSSNGTALLDPVVQAYIDSHIATARTEAGNGYLLAMSALVLLMTPGVGKHSYNLAHIHALAPPQNAAACKRMHRFTHKLWHAGLFYAGIMGAKNALSPIMLAFLSYAVVAVQW
jgi:hypothetical protein